MARIRILGIFEDAAQRDFHRGVVGRCAFERGLDVEILPRLTHGCRFEFLAEFLEAAQQFSGTLIAVDAKKLGVTGKVAALERGLERLGLRNIPAPVLWSAAVPSVEEWMMADPEALPRALKEVLQLRTLQHASRPGPAAAEQTAKKRLASWASALVGDRLLQGGREYAEVIGRHVAADRVGVSRNQDLKDFLIVKLPEFLKHCVSAG